MFGGNLSAKLGELRLPPSAVRGWRAAPATTAEPNTSIGALPAGGGLDPPARVLDTYDAHRYKQVPQ